MESLACGQKWSTIILSCLTVKFSPVFFTQSKISCHRNFSNGTCGFLMPLSLIRNCVYPVLFTNWIVSLPTAMCQDTAKKCNKTWNPKGGCWRNILLVCLCSQLLIYCRNTIWNEVFIGHDRKCDRKRLEENSLPKVSHLIASFCQSWGGH